ncbi:MAG: PfkB family carbohydrate kinase, partial [Pontibacterium sp.]
GDSFAAGYVYGRLLGKSATTAAQIGHQLASKVIQHPGAIIHKDDMPNIVD